MAWLNNQRKVEWVVYAKRPFAGPQAVLAYLSRYTHRVAIANSRLVAMDDKKETDEIKTHEPSPTFVYPCCGAAMIVTEVLLHLYLPRAPPKRLN